MLITQSSKKTKKLRFKRWICCFCGLVLLVITLAILNNNISASSVSHTVFISRVDFAMALSMEWLKADMQNMFDSPNAALFHMIADMADLSDDPYLRNVIEHHNAQSGWNIWRRLTDKDADILIPEPWEVDRLEDYQRWILYALEPAHIQLTQEDKASMFAPDSHYWGSLTHQLFSLYFYQDRQGSSAALQHLTDHLCERIAFEAVWDIRVTDLYLQRIAFILAAGRDDLIKKRWVERLLAHQQDDGGWMSGWHGWGPDLFRFTFRQRSTTAHPTVQGMWVLWMIRHRYPEWIARNYEK